MSDKESSHYSLYTDGVVEDSRRERARYNGTMPSGGQTYNVETWLGRSASWPQARRVETMKLARADYRMDPANPEIVTKYKRLVWEERGNLLGVNFEIPDVDRDSRELRQIIAERRTMIYRPRDIDWRMLNKLDPRLRLGLNKILLNHLDDTHDGIQYGWIDVESDLGQPHNYRTEHNVIDKFSAMGKAPMDFVTFGICLLDNYDLNKSMLGKGGWTRLSGSRLGDRGISVRVNPNSSLRISSHISPDREHLNLGARSIGGKRG